MKPAYAVYALQVEWTWDHANDEIATFTVEGTEGCRYEPEFERLLDPEFPKHRKEAMLDDLRAIAAALGRGTAGDSKIVRLYRVEDTVGMLNGGQPDAAFKAGRLAVVQMTLRPICSFDAEGQPVPLQAAATDQPTA